jgi:hypothetical protein
VEPDVLAPVGADLDDLGRDRRQVHAGRRRYVFLVERRLGLARDREEVEDRAAAVVQAHHVEAGAGPARGEEAAEIVEERQLARQQPGGQAGGERCARRRRDHAVDAVGTAVCEEAQPLGRLREAGLDVAHGHR